ncbi:MAG: hypothetical protein NUV56_00405 [Candidatus Uhrbacteria bacterium]|nr:hypothetical protein [Candidatus Uhrbacteria bacterium]
MEKRTSLILKLIIDEYVRTAEPVSSQGLCQRYALPLSSATVRNEMMALEAAGYIYQPHTSSGRVPTEEGYRFYLANFLKRQPVTHDAGMRQALEHIRSLEQRIQGLGRRLAELSGDAVMLASPQHTSAHGVANLLRKPDFRDENMLLALAEDIERLETSAQEVIDIAPNEVKVLIGDENPLGRRLATVIVKHRLPNGEVGVLTIVGPLRMNYARNIALLSQAKQLLDDIES